MVRFGLNLLIILVLIFSFAETSIAAPSNLTLTPLSDTEIYLYWNKGNELETYDVWKTENGDWTRITSSVSGNTYLVNQGINPYKNLYFIVTSSPTHPNDTLSLGGSLDQGTNIATAFVPGQTAHESYKKNTNSCSKCHRTHNAKSPVLLSEETVSDTCATCHDGTGSKYNAFTGKIYAGQDQVGQPLDLIASSGPFGNFLGKTGSDFEASVVSIHSVNDSVYKNESQEILVSSAPGAIVNSDGGWKKKFSCGSCHDVHPVQNSYNYRMLRRILPGDPTDPVNTSPIRIISFAKTDIADSRENVFYRAGMTDFCTGCHQERNPSTAGYVYDQYHAHVGKSLYDNPNYSSLNISLPLEGSETLPENYNKNKIMCITCHNSHGSNSKTDEIVGNADPYNDGDYGYTNYLLKKDYDGVCVECHGS